jgi:hypothetical protein
MQFTQPFALSAIQNNIYIHTQTPATRSPRLSDFAWDLCVRTHIGSLCMRPCLHSRCVYTYMRAACIHTLLENITTETHAQDTSADILRVWLSGYILKHTYTHLKSEIFTDPFDSVRAHLRV